LIFPVAGCMNMAMDDSARTWMKFFARAAAAMGALFGLLGIAMLYYYIREAFPETTTRLIWWAVLSIVLSVLFLLAYFIANDSVRSMEREARRRIDSK